MAALEPTDSNSADAVEQDPTAGTMRIGDVLERLREFHPDVKDSTLRYYDTKGLVVPQRSSGGMRLYSEVDFERLCTIFSLHSRSMSLDAIKERLDQAEASGRTRTTILKAVEESDSVHEEISDGYYTAGEIAQRFDVPVKVINDLASARVISAEPDGLFHARCVRSVNAALQLARYGVEARHLRVVSSAVERQTELVEKVHRSMAAADHDLSGEAAADTARTIAAGLQILQSEIFHNAVTRIVSH